MTVEKEQIHKIQKPQQTANFNTSGRPRNFQKEYSKRSKKIIGKYGIYDPPTKDYDSR